MRKIKSDKDHELARATLKRASGKGGWANVSFTGLAKDLKVPLATLTKRFRSPADLVPLIDRYFAAEFEASFEACDGSPRDRLFSVLMAFFDILQQHRPAVLQIEKAARHDARLFKMILKSQRGLIENFLARVELNVSILQRAMAGLGLNVIYLSSFCVWKRDETLDMSKTMAAIDRSLRWSEKLAATIFRFG